MELSFNNGRFVSLMGDLNYREVIDDFSNAKTIRIITYNISKSQKYDKLLNSLKNTDADIQMITNVPSRMNEYFNTNKGNDMRSAAKRNIQIYISKLNPDNFNSKFEPFFNVRNHAKLIGTENIVYIGSANYSNESADNIEAGVLITDKIFIRQLYEEFFDKVRENSISYFDENFSAFRLFALSLYAKFNRHYHKMLTDLYTDYLRSDTVLADTIFMDLSDLDDIYIDLDELSTICSAADDTYDETNENYNDSLEQLKRRFNDISIDWLKEIISEGSLYKLIAFNSEEEFDDILQTEYSSEAYDEHLDEYVQKVMNDVSEIYYDLHNAFNNESREFLAEIEKILSALEAAICFTSKWKAVKINPDIDNT